MGRGGSDEHLPAPLRTSGRGGTAGRDPDYYTWYEPQAHDYDPSWDYDVREDLFSHDLLIEAQEHLDELAARNDTPFSRGYVFPASLTDRDAVGVYVSGTSSEPVVMFDPVAHEAAAPDEVRRTIEHEVVHAVQEATDRPADEAEAEAHRFD